MATISRLYEGWTRADLDLALEQLDPGIVWTAIEGAPDAGTYVGREGARAYMQDWLDDFDLHGNDIEEAIEAGDDRLVCVQRARGTGRASGVETELHYTCVYTFRGERLGEVHEYATRAEALRAVGLPE